MDGLNEVDSRILDILRKDARKSYTDIAGEVGISRVSVKNRINSMMDKGIIREFKVVTDETTAMDNYVEFLLDIEVNPDFYGEVLDDLGKEKGLDRIVSASGRCRVIAFGHTSNQKLLSGYVDRLYYRMRGIKALSVLTFLSTFKDDFRGVEYVPSEERNKE